MVERPEQGFDEAVMRVFLAALEHPEERRAAFVREACEGDRELEREVHSLLDHDAGEDELLDEPIARAPSAGSLVRPAEVPSSIGGFEVLRVLGSGGMGTVYLARQVKPQRDVALKVLATEGASSRSVRRFEEEAEVLGRMQHPGIAQVFEAGTHGDPPRLYIAMERVDGPAITEFARRRSLEVRERLSLVARVADAVHHAHQRGVIHRDIKPDNVLVDSSGQPKVLDFGVARVERDGGEGPVGRAMTDAGQLLGTVAYMSPEQVAGPSDELDIRTDVYSLGVVAYELLTGAPPYHVESQSLRDAVDTVLYAEPPKVDGVPRAMREDIDALLATALAKDRRRRYESAAAFAADIRRLLANEPLVARPPSMLYALGKFARRRKAFVAATLATFASLVAGLIVATWLTFEAGEQARRAHAVRDVLQQVLFSADPMNEGTDVRVLDVLEDIDGAIDEFLGGHPREEVSLRTDLGRLYRSCGDINRGEYHLRIAHSLALETLERSDPVAIECTHQLARLLIRYGRNLEEAGALLREALAQQHRMDREFGYEVRREAASLERQRDNLAGAELVYRELIADLSASGDHEVLLHQIRNALAMTLLGQERWDDAERVVRDARAARTLAADHRISLLAQFGLGRTLATIGEKTNDDAKLAEAEDVLRANFEGRIQRLGTTHPGTLNTLTRLAEVLHARCRYDESLELFEMAADGYREAWGWQTVESSRLVTSMSRLLRDMDRAEDANALRREFDRVRAGVEHEEL